MKQTNSTKTNPEKTDASAEKGNEGQEGTHHKTSLSSLQRGARPLLSKNQRLVPETVCFQVIKTTLTVKNVRKTWSLDYQPLHSFWNCDKHQLKHNHLAF